MALFAVFEVLYENEFGSTPCERIAKDAISIRHSSLKSLVQISFQMVFFDDPRTEQGIPLHEFFL
jgi:hypothetical protein